MTAPLRPSPRRVLTVGLACVAALAACRPDHASEPPELDADEHLLLTPRGNPEELLGRTVTPDDKGGFVLSDERPPGCEVTVKRVPERWHRTYQQDIGKVAHIGTGNTPIGDLTARYGKTMRIDADIANLEVLEGDLRGCTGMVVGAVKVGTGKREIRAAEEAKVEAHVKAKGVPVGAGAGKWRTVERGLEWTDPQAWAFVVRDQGGTSDLRVELVLLPESVRHGEVFTVRVLAARQVYLVIGFVSEAGKTGLLLPNGRQPTPIVNAGGNVELTLQASLPLLDTPSRDKFVLYAFAERGDFDMFKPPPGNLDAATVAKYFDELPGRLASIPTRRWTKTEGYLLIEP
ncbi:MAG: hypothetical protein IPH07_26215 [Deltaproteobacteria bacterium]|nr:hypothetical protein [Deltaproteobacteria bacterium]MBK8240466.1 hypothetical protein [Deltaproteobacteria bacterium]